MGQPTAHALGTVYGCLLNSRSQWRAAELIALAAPYQAAPKHPVLFVKPRNTFNATPTVSVPRGHEALSVGASLSLVFMPNFAINPTLVTESIESVATDSIAWCQLMIDWHLPHSASSGGFYRPPLKFNAHDGLLGLGAPRVAIGGPLAELALIELVLEIDGVDVLSWRLTNTVRSPSQLLVDVTAFMTPQPLDALMLGHATGPNGELPLARLGQHVKLHSPTHPSLGSITQTLVAE